MDRQPRASIGRALERVGLADCFHEICCYAELGHRKSDPRFWQAAQTSLKLPPGRIATMGDSLEQQCPRAALLRSAGRTGAPPGLPVVTRLEQFAGMILDAAPTTP